jgi:outer membrane protein with glycine zipper
MVRNRAVRAGVVVAVVGVAVSLAGCEHMNNTEKGAGIGGALGAGAGLAVGAATGNPRTGAAVGGLLGAGTGALVGNDVDRQEQRDREIKQAVATAEAQAQQQRLGLTDVIHLVQQGHDDQVIINQIRSSGSTFQLTPSDLDYLKNSGVSARVIAEMQAARGPVAPRVVGPAPTTVIYEPIYGPPPVFIGPAYCAPRPYVFIGGHFGPRCR